jgi:sulfhydrogenase subunit beta (sulfur reductase)
VPHLFTEANENQAKKKQEIKKRSENLIKQKLSLSQIEQHLDRLFDSKLWNDIAMKCLGCSVCTYLCPTCHCFDIQDQADLNNGKRIRIWDSCSNPEYTMHASGHNPRPARMNRLRNRIYHKYNYYPKNFDAIACVGCGRCIVKCPVNIDIMDVLCKVKQS